MPRVEFQQQARKATAKRDTSVFDFDAGPELKRPKKDSALDHDAPFSHTDSQPPRKVKKEPPGGDFEFLPEMKPNTKKGADLAELGATLQRKSGSSSQLSSGGSQKTSPAKPGSHTATSPSSASSSAQHYRPPHSGNSSLAALFKSNPSSQITKQSSKDHASPNKQVFIIRTKSDTLFDKVFSFIELRIHHESKIIITK